jgi:glycosyltransferase involved in cell wall biosynthesis
MTPRVTVGLPFADNRETLGLAIRSVLAQTERDWELLLVDDGSSDGSRALAESVDDPRVRFLGDGERRGLAVRLNEIVQAARAPIIARMDADDQMAPGRLARQLAVLEADPSLDIVASDLVALDATGRPTGRRKRRPLPVDTAGVLRHGYLSHPTVTGRRTWFLANPYGERWRRAEDFELWCRTVGRVRVLELPEPLLFYREPVPVNLAAYLETFRARRAITIRYGPAAIGWLSTAGLVARTWLQPLAYRLARACGLERRLVGRRNRPLESGERLEAEAVLREIAATPWPLRTGA